MQSPRFIAEELERIFVVIDRKMCYIYIWLWLAGCQNIWNLGNISVVLLFEFFAPNLFQNNPYKIYFKIINFWPPWVQLRLNHENFVRFEFLTPKLPQTNTHIVEITHTNFGPQSSGPRRGPGPKILQLIHPYNLENRLHKNPKSLSLPSFSNKVDFHRASHPAKLSLYVFTKNALKTVENLNRN